MTTKLVLLLVVVFGLSAAHAQDDHVWKPASKESEAYHEYRMKMTTPPYGLAKIKALIAKIEVDDEDTEALDPGVYNALSLREKFTYHLIHAESYSQDSEPMQPVQDEHKKIFAFLPDAFGEYNWSDRQSSFLKRNRDSVIALMKESITRTKRVGLNFKQAILEINAKEMIPLLITAYNATKKDLDILTLFMLLMKENEYEPFLVSASYKKLYSADSGYLSYLNYNNNNEDLVIKRATDFYNAGKK